MVRGEVIITVVVAMALTLFCYDLWSTIARIFGGDRQ